MKDKPFVTFEELAISTMLEVQALIRIPERKGLITSEEVGVFKEEMEEKIRRMGSENSDNFILKFPNF